MTPDMEILEHLPPVWIDATDEFFDTTSKNLKFHGKIVCAAGVEDHVRNGQGLDELAVMVRIYSPDTYELLPELVSKIQNHIDYMQRFDYILEMLDMTLLFTRYISVSKRISILILPSRINDIFL